MKAETLESLVEVLSQYRNLTTLGWGNEETTNSWIEKHVQAVTKLLSNTTAPKSLQTVVFGAVNVTSSCISQLADVVAQSTTLKSIRKDQGPDGSPVNPKSLKRLHDVLANNTNTTLEECYFARGPGLVNSRIRFYMKVNKLGRQRLLAPTNDVSSREVRQTFIDNRADVAVVYYSLRHDPSILPPCQNRELEP